MRDSQGNIVSTRKANAYYEDNLGIKPSLSQEKLDIGIKKANQNELLRQIDAKKRRDREAKMRDQQEDLALENRVRQELKKMNQDFVQEFSHQDPGAPKPKVPQNYGGGVMNSIDFSQKSNRKSRLDSSLPKVASKAGLHQA